MKGNFPLFDNVTALFSATPVITRTAAYLLACTEWIEDGFKGREPLHEIYSRLLNPTSISLATHIVDIECGLYAHESERPDFVVHSYTKDLAGFGNTTAGVVIGKTERMFMPEGDQCEFPSPAGNTETVTRDATLLWNVYYIKGAFLDSDKAFEVLNGLKTYEMRALHKAIITLVLARVLDEHPGINVNCPALEAHPNHPMMKKVMRQGWPAGWFTIDIEGDVDSGVEAVKQIESLDSLSARRCQTPDVDSKDRNRCAGDGQGRSWIAFNSVNSFIAFLRRAWHPYEPDLLV